MQQLRSEVGVKLLAHGTRGKPRPIQLQLHAKSITWHLQPTTTDIYNKNHRVHIIPLNEILHVDIGKHTNALRNLSDEGNINNNCFFLLTKQGSLDLQCMSEVERDALINSFSFILIFTIN